MRLNSKLAMNMTENTHLHKHIIMYMKIYINMLTQKDELAVAKTHHDIASKNLRLFTGNNHVKGYQSRPLQAAVQAAKMSHLR